MLVLPGRASELPEPGFPWSKRARADGTPRRDRQPSAPLPHQPPRTSARNRRPVQMGKADILDAVSDLSLAIRSEILARLLELEAADDSWGPSASERQLLDEELEDRTEPEPGSPWKAAEARLRRNRSPGRFCFGPGRRSWPSLHSPFAGALALGR